MRNKNLLISVFFLFFLVYACQDQTENASEESDTVLTAEEIYFEDYESPQYHWGFIDVTGEPVIQAEFDAVGKFSEGFAAANFKGKWGYIDLDGKKIVDYQFRAAHPIRNGVGRVETFDGAHHFIRSNGEPLSSTVYNLAGDFSEGLARVSIGNQWGYIDTNGDIAIHPEFDRAWDFTGGFAKIQINGKFGLIDQTGDLVAQAIYDKIGNPANGFIRVYKDGQWSFLNNAGEAKFNGFQSATDFDQQTAYVKKDNQYYHLSTTGKLSEIEGVKAIPRTLNNGRWIIRTDNGFAILDHRGSIISQDDYQQINPFYEGMAAYMKGELWGYIDTSGQELVGPVFGLAWNFSNGLARAAFRDGIAYIDKTMRPPFYPRCRDMQDFTEGRAAFQEF